MNFNILGLLTPVYFAPIQSKYMNITIFMSLNDFVGPNVYDCYWTLLIFSVLQLSIDHYLQDSKKNERMVRSYTRKGIGYEVLVAYTTCKQAKDVADMIAGIYKVGPLTYPKIFQCDNGSKFKAEVTKMLEKHEVRIQCATTKYKHTHTEFVEALNKIQGEQLFKVQDTQELNDLEKISATWVKHLYGLVDKLNNTQITRMKPKDAIKLNQVPLVNQENYPPEDTLPEDGLYRYLLQPGEEHNDQSKRATDNIWSKKIYRLREIVQGSGNQPMYYLKDGLERAFMKEDLMLIPKDT